MVAAAERVFRSALGAQAATPHDQRVGDGSATAALEQHVRCELGASKRGDHRFGSMDVAAVDGLAGRPWVLNAAGVRRIGAQPRRVGERDDEMGLGSQYTMDLAKDPVEIVDVTEAVHRDC